MIQKMEKPSKEDEFTVLILKENNKPTCYIIMIKISKL
jgi:hypothetical protein